MKVTLLGFFPYNSKKTGKDSICVYIGYEQSNVTGLATTQCFLEEKDFLVENADEKIGKTVEADVGFNNRVTCITD